MMGIMPDDFDLLLKKNDTILKDVLNDLSKVQNSCLSVNSNLFSNDLKFFNNKFNLEIIQLKNVSNKLNGYQNTLKSVLEGYQKQSKQNVIDTRNFMS